MTNGTRLGSLLPLAVLAAGFIPAAIAPAGPPPTAAPLSIELAVLTPDGRPAGGAAAVLVPATHFVVVTDGRSFDADPTYLHATADAAGRLTFPAAALPYLVVVIHDAGSAKLDDRDVAAGRGVTLAAWGRVDGRVREAGRPAAGRKVIVRSLPASTADDDTARPSATFRNDVVTDADGRFTVARMAAGPASATPQLPVADPRILAPATATFVDVPAGGAARADIGGHGLTQGRAVVGRVVVPASVAAAGTFTVDFGSIFGKPGPPPPPIAMPADLTMAGYAEWSAAQRASPARRARDVLQVARMRHVQATEHPFDVRPDGTFRIEDVTPGEYQFYAEVAGHWKADKKRDAIAEAKVVFTVPALPAEASTKPSPARSPESSSESLPEPVVAPLDLGDVVAKVPSTSVGRSAFRFDVPGFDDRRVRLADYAGRFVLVDFWGVWCGACLAETPNLKAVFAKHGGDPRFAMISLATDDSPVKPMRYAAANGFAWPQGYLGSDDDPVQAAYGVQSWPTILLIGPDGTIVKPYLRGESIEAAVAKALGK